MSALNMLLLFDVCSLEQLLEFNHFFTALISIRKILVYYKTGDDIMLPCTLGSSYYSCSSVLWMYSKDVNTESEIKPENRIAKTSAEAGKNCSLVIRDITAEHAGLYTCWTGKDSRYNTYVYLNILKSEYFDFTDILTTSLSIVL